MGSIDLGEPETRARSALYYAPVEVDAEDLALQAEIDRIYTKWPFYDSRRIVWELRQRDQEVNRKRVQRLMHVMGLQALAPGPHTSKPHPEHRIYPYLSRRVAITRPNQVWAADITYTPLEGGWGYLAAIMDWYSRIFVERLWRSLKYEDVYLHAYARSTVGSAQPHDEHRAHRSQEIGPASDVLHRHASRTTAASTTRRCALRLDVFRPRQTLLRPSTPQPLQGRPGGREAGPRLR